MSVIVDAHQHFWRYDPRDYAWIDDRMRVLECDFLPGDLEPLIRQQGIDRTIAVQACQTSLDVAFDCFGPARLIAGSDWPVCTLAGDYSRTMAVLRDYLERRTPAERAAVLGGNAQRVWKRASF